MHIQSILSDATLKGVSGARLCLEGPNVYSAPTKTAHDAARSLSDDGQVKLLEEIRNIWRNDPDDELVKIFGDDIVPFRQSRLMYTLTVDKRQLRAWYAFPSRFDLDHVDSAGHGLLWDVHGESNAVEKVCNELFHRFPDHKPMYRSTLANGIAVYGLEITFDWVFTGKS